MLSKAPAARPREAAGRQEVVMALRYVRGVLLLVALGAAPARARAQAPASLPAPRVSGRSVALIVARAEAPLPKPADPLSSDALALVPAANDVGTPSAWRQWAQRGARIRAVSHLDAAPDATGIMLHGAPVSPATFSDR